MGSWGFHPMDSDYALDLFAEVNDVVKETLKAMFDGIGTDEPSTTYGYIGVVEMLLKNGFFIPTDIVGKCVGYLDIALNDKDYMGAWSDQEKARKEVTEFRDAMKKLVDEANGGDNILAPRGWMCRDFELEPGSSRSGLFELNKDKD